MSSRAGRGLDPWRVMNFLFLWLGLGFAGGTGTLLGPVRWVTTAMRADGWSDGAERAVVLAIIGAYVALTCWLAVWLSGWMARTSTLRFVAPLAVWGAAAGCLWLWLTPQVVNSMQPVQLESVSRFTFGPYPDEARFEQLRDEGFTAIVTLLHPAVVPFESNLLAQEREMAAAFGIELIEAPMLPWVSDNKESVEAVRRLASADDGKYYVHCYLGRDRVGTVRRLIERTTGGGRVADVRGAAAPAKDLLAKPWERGPAFEIDDGVFLVPYPTDEELFSRVLSGNYHVVSLLDPANRDDRPWIRKERETLDEYEVPFNVRPISWKRYEPMAALAAAEFVRALPRPVIVHAFRSESVAASAFRLAYVSRSAPVAGEKFVEPMLGGAAQVLGANVVVGPRPAGPEFGTYLATRGIRGIVYVGDARRAGVDHDRIVATREAGLEWRAVRPEIQPVLDVLRSGGPWYVYGSGLGAVQGRIADHFGPQLAALEEAPVIRAGGM